MAHASQARVGAMRTQTTAAGPGTGRAVGVGMELLHLLGHVGPDLLHGRRLRCAASDGLPAGRADRPALWNRTAAPGAGS